MFRKSLWCFTLIDPPKRVTISLPVIDCEQHSIAKLQEQNLFSIKVHHLLAPRPVLGGFQYYKERKFTSANRKLALVFRNVFFVRMENFLKPSGQLCNILFGVLKACNARLFVHDVMFPNTPEIYKIPSPVFGMF